MAGRTPRGDGSRFRDAAFVFQLFGTVLLMPPFLNLFRRELVVWGIPTEVIYLFAVWLAIVGGAFWLSRHLRAGNGEPPGQRTATGKAPD